MTLVSEPPRRWRIFARLCSRAPRSTSTQAGRRAAWRSSTPGALSAAGGLSEGSGRGFDAMPVEVPEAGGLTQEDEVDRAGLPVPVLGDDQLRQALVLLGLVVDLVTVDERHHVGVLLDGVVDEEIVRDEVVGAGNRQIEDLLFSVLLDRDDLIPVDVALGQSPQGLRAGREGDPQSPLPAEVLLEDRQPRVRRLDLGMEPAVRDAVPLHRRTDMQIPDLPRDDVAIRVLRTRGKV